MPLTYQRSFVKGLCWEFISFILTIVAIFIVYGNLVLSIKFSLALSAIKVTLFFVHERAWKKIKWGKIK